MECNDIRRHFSEYIDDACTPEIRKAIEQHLASCAECREEMETYRSFQKAFSALTEEELPFDFQPNLEERLAEEKRRHVRKPLYKRTWFKAVAACACLVLVIGIFSLAANMFGSVGSMDEAITADMDWNGAASSYATPMDTEAYTRGADSDYGEEMPAEDVEMWTDDATSSSGKGYEAEEQAINQDGAAQAVERKIITNWYLSIKVDDFDVAFSAVEEMAKAYGGYVVSGYTYNDDYNQQGYISIRVDAELVDAAVEALKTLGTVEDSNFTTNDITMEYYDLQSRLTQYRAQEARLLELYDQAENIEDLLAIETELVRIQSEIDSLEGTIRYYDQLTTLSLIEVSLYSPGVYAQTVEPKGWEAFGKNLKEGFLNGINQLLDALAAFVVWLAGALPVLVLLVAAVVVVVLLVIRHRRKRN